MTAPASTVDQNILPVQALFDVQGNFQTFIGQGKQFSTGGGSSLTIADVTTNSTFYPVFSAVSSGTVTVLDVTSTKLSFNPSSGALTSTSFVGSLTGNASGLSGGATGSLPYQSGANTTSFLSAGTNGYVLTMAGGLPTWAAASGSGLTITDDTTTNATRYLTFTSATSGSITGENTSSTKLQFNPSTGAFTSTSLTPTNAVGIAYGGTNATATPTAGAIAYGTGTAYAFTSAGTTGQVLTSNGAGAPTWSAASSGTVTSVGGTGTVNGITLTGTVTTSGSLTLGGTLSGVSLTTQVSGVLPVANGGTNASTAGITAFNNITGYTASGATGTTSTNLVFSTSPTITTATVTGIKETSVAIAASAIDLSAGNYFTKTISGTTTFTISNAASSGTVNSFILQLTNGGSATVNWFSGVKWAGGTAPTLTASGYDDIGFFSIDGGTTWQGFVLGLKMS